jgi:hypothetical protein
MILAVMQTSPPVPRQTADHQASQTDKREHKPTAGQSNAAPSVASPASPSAPQGKETTAAESHKNAEETIRVSELPPVTVKTGPDWWTRAYVLLTGFLVTIGFFGVCYARRSLRAIESQLVKMGQQVTEMQNAGMQTGQIIERMKDTAERELRAYVCMESARIVFKKERAPEVHVCVKNFGKTPAYDVRMWIGGATGPYPAPEPLKPAPNELPMGVSVLPPGAKPYTMIWRSDEIPQQVMPILGTKAFTIYVYGRASYRDAFGKQRNTKYRLIFGGREPHNTVVNEGGFRMGNMKTDGEGNEAD